MAGKKKTTFAKLNREAKIREKRQEKDMRRQERQRAAETGDDEPYQPEDLSHLDVDVVDGVVPDVTVKQ